MNKQHDKPSVAPPVSANSVTPPPLSLKHRSFLCFLATQAFGAFNDNVLKQLVLLLGVGYLIAGVGYQAIVQFLFAITFLIFSGIAGDLADRYSKGRIMTLCKVAEIFIALAGVGVFVMAAGESSNSNEAPLYLWLLALVIFTLGTQSAFFGPPKYGGLPEIGPRGRPCTGNRPDPDDNISINHFRRGIGRFIGGFFCRQTLCGRARNSNHCGSRDFNFFGHCPSTAYRPDKEDRTTIICQCCTNA